MLFVVAAIAAATTMTVAVVASSPPPVDAGATTTVAPTTTAAATTTTARPTTTAVLPTLPEPANAETDPVRTIVPRIVAYEEALETEQQRQQAITTALSEGQNSIAVEQPPAMLCAIVPVPTPLTAEGRWERDGDPFVSDEMARRDPPGYGDCITAGDDEVFDEGVFQYVAVGPTGATSAVATLVVGVPSVVVWLLNDGDQPVCLVQASPSDADRYESFDAGDAPLAPGQAVAIRLAATDQDVRVYGCPPDDVLRSFDLAPQFGVYVELLGDQPDESVPPAPPGSTTSTTTRPTTTG
jgi:hypothetical protein